MRKNADIVREFRYIENQQEGKRSGGRPVPGPWKKMQGRGH